MSKKSANRKKIIANRKKAQKKKKARVGRPEYNSTLLSSDIIDFEISNSETFDGKLLVGMLCALK